MKNYTRYLWVLSPLLLASVMDANNSNYKDMGKYLDHQKVLELGGVGNYVDRGTWQSAQSAKTDHVSENDDSKRVSLNEAKSELNFDVDSAQIKPEAKQSLSKIAQKLASRSDQQIRVEGYTDATGSVAYNDQLAEKRAKAVKEVLSENGMKDSQLKIAAYGKDYPIAPNSTPKGRADNLRVELHLSG